MSSLLERLNTSDKFQKLQQLLFKRNEQVQKLSTLCDQQREKIVQLERELKSLKETTTAKKTKPRKPRKASTVKEDVTNVDSQ